MKPPPNANSRPIRSASFISTSPKFEPLKENCIFSSPSTERRSSPSSNCMRRWRVAPREPILRRLIAAVPYKVHTVLTDNGTHFTTPGNTSSAAPDIKAALNAAEPIWAHAFEYACAQSDIEHRLTKPYHPWTTDVIDKCFFAGSELFSSRARATAWRRAGREAQALPRSLHRRPSVAAPVRACFGPRGFQPATKRAYAVSACSTHLRS